MILDDNCKCICGLDTEPHIDKFNIYAGEKFNCPGCGKALRVGMGDRVIEKDGEYETENYFYVVD